MGIGEHYTGAGWEDRASLVQGPVLLQLRNSARRLLLNQGQCPESGQGDAGVETPLFWCCEICPGGEAFIVDL